MLGVSIGYLIDTRCSIRIFEGIIQQPEYQLVVIYRLYNGLVIVDGKVIEPLMDLCNVALVFVLAHIELADNVLVEVLKQLFTSCLHRRAYLLVHLLLYMVEGGIDFFGSTTVLVDVKHPLLKVNTALHRAKDFVAGAKDAIEKMELLIQQLIYPHIGFVLHIDEVAHYHIILLAITMTASDALLHTLRIPRQVEVDDERAELEVDTLRSCLGRYHDVGCITEIVHNSLTLVGRLGGRYHIFPFIGFQPIGIYLL